MRSGFENNSQTHESSTETLELKHRQELELQGNDFSSSEATHSSVTEQIKQGTESIIRRVEKVCTPLASRDDLKTAGNGKATGSGWVNTSPSPA